MGQKIPRGEQNRTVSTTSHLWADTAQNQIFNRKQSRDFEQENFEIDFIPIKKTTRQNSLISSDAELTKNLRSVKNSLDHPRLISSCVPCSS